MTPGLPASIHARLRNRAQERGEEFQLVLQRYAIERYLYRLSLTPARERMWLKGALLFDLWFDLPHRPTQDADFLGIGEPDAEVLAGMVRDACGIAVEDGMEYDVGTISISEIREDARYGGLRVKLVGRLGRARCYLQLDVGYGDAVTPGPEEAEFPVLLADQPAARLRVYPRATVVAEKLEAIVSLGMTNSRMKDFFDLRALSRGQGIAVEQLAEAIRRTFTRRGTPLSAELPLGLSEAFGRDALKRTQWHAFLRKNRLEAPALDEVVNEVRAFVEGPLRMASRRQS